MITILAETQTSWPDAAENIAVLALAAFVFWIVFR